LGATFREDTGLFLLQLGLSDSGLLLHPTLGYFRSLAAAFPRKLLLHPDVEALRGKTPVEITEEEIRLQLDLAPPMPGAEYLESSVLRNLWESMRIALAHRLETFSGSVEDFVNGLGQGSRELGRIHFHLVEHKSEVHPFAFLATYGSHVGQSGRARHLPLRHALEEFTDTARRLAALKSLYAAGAKSSWLKRITENGGVFRPLLLTPAEAHFFLKDVEGFQEAGILCRIPDFWKSARQGAALKLNVGEKSAGDLNAESLISLGLELTLGGEAVTEAELRRLAEVGEGLALVKGKWVAVDPEKVKEALALLVKAKKLLKRGGISLSDAFKLLLRRGEAGLKDLAEMEGLEITQGQWLQELITQMRNPALIQKTAVPKGLKAKLRPYQKLGLHWLNLLHTLKFGACLADDMGLGKTIQVIALLQAHKEKNPKRPVNALLVAPASLLFNWMREIERFAPDLRFHTAHAQFDGKAAKGGIDLTLTTYAMAEKLDWVKKQKWSLIIADEAQALKNPGAKQTRAVKALQAESRIALTGTPIENRLSDLWSLFDFLNPGLLGSFEEFSRFQKRIQNDPEGYASLRRTIAPYLLRRLKTDKNLLPDLPDKVEIKARSELTKKQVALYRRLAQKMASTLESVDGIQRQGLVLSYLIKFKQVCNHPDHFSGSGGFAESDSGKFQLLREICEPIRDKRERVLVFTQFAEMAEPLSEFLAALFGREGLILTGKTPIAKRRKVVDSFQGDAWVPYLVLSVKAGGTGLNLTRASHVVHFDRWWNPAVENQATDRAFRIGQTKNVLVHKFISAGTLEEKIDALIEKKTDLARDIIGATGEAWIGNMSNGELLELFSLSPLETIPNPRRGVV
jgi:non-specific serine/threonine protein kinase